MSKKRILAIIYRHMSMWKRDFDRIADTFWWPVLDLVIWGFVTIFIQKQSGATVAVLFFLGGAILWGVVNRAQLDIGMSFLQEAWDRNLLNIFASPITTVEFITATIILGIIKLSLSLLMVSLLAWLLYAFNILEFGLYLIPFVANLLIMGWWVGLLLLL